MVQNLRMTSDLDYMLRALLLARRGGRAVMPNPRVGAVVVHNDQVIGEGYHQRYGGPHAEVNAIDSVQSKELLQDSTLYVTLEPCSHFGKTPPCVDKILASRIPRVVVGCRDPFPEVAGRGIARLREAGIEVREDVARDECLFLNRRFILAHRLGRPYIILKWAETADGFLAPLGGKPTWITSEHSKQLVHRWRALEMAIMVGAATAANDDPRLTVRETQLCDEFCQPIQNPLRVTIDTNASLSPHLNIFNNEAETIVFAPGDVAHRGTVTHYPITADTPLPLQICRTLNERTILSLIVEGGAKTLQGFLDGELWDEIRVFRSNTTFGKGILAPAKPTLPHRAIDSGGDTLMVYAHPELSTRLGSQYSLSRVLESIEI